MGITGLAKLIADIAPNAIKENEIKNHFGKLLVANEFFYVILTRNCHFTVSSLIVQAEKLQSTLL